MFPNSRGYLHPFLNGRTYLYGVGELPRTLTELAMCKFSARIRSSDNWWLNIHQHTFRDHWIVEGTTSIHTVLTSSGKTNVTLSRRQVEYVLDELINYASLREPDKNCEVSCFDRIWQTIEPIPLDFKLPLEDTPSTPVPEGEYPQTHIDIIDPCAYPLVYGRTLQLTDDKTLKATSIPQAWYYAFSTRFSYLPTAFAISNASQPCLATALGYINGAPLSMPEVSEDVAHILTRAIPLFENVLTDLHRDNPLRHRIPGACKHEDWDQLDGSERSDDAEGRSDYDEEHHWSSDRPAVQNEPDIPREGYLDGLTSRSTRIHLRGKTVNVVVRMTQIRLQPDCPVQGSSPWHAEGMVNEHIIACAYTCVAARNIHPLSLSYRMAVQAPVNIVPGDVGATMRTWGLQDGAPSHQYLGRSSLSPGRIAAYPNIYQTQISGTALVDPTQEGSATLLGLYLVDPDFPGGDGDGEILTTSSVPHQDVRWLHKALGDYVDIRIPLEIIDKIAAEVDWLMSEDEYKECAAKMRREREAFCHTHDQLWFSVPFSGWKDQL